LTDLSLVNQRYHAARANGFKGEQTSFPSFPSPFSHFFAIVPIFARPKSEKCFLKKPVEIPTETLDSQASLQESQDFWKLPVISNFAC